MLKGRAWACQRTKKGAEAVSGCKKRLSKNVCVNAGRCAQFSEIEQRARRRSGVTSAREARWFKCAAVSWLPWSSQVGGCVQFKRLYVAPFLCAPRIPR
jgi:hypothetical protein